MGTSPTVINSNLLPIFPQASNLPFNLRRSFHCSALCGVVMYSGDINKRLFSHLHLLSTVRQAAATALGEVHPTALQHKGLF